jgi:hypothetical protein
MRSFDDATVNPVRFLKGLSENYAIVCPPVFADKGRR